MKKILIIRFSSIGDIVLTSPVVRCVKLQTGGEVHFLTKKKYISILESNPYVDKIISFENNLNVLLVALRKEKYNYVIDLHNNLRSFWIKLYLQKRSYTIRKKNLEKFLFIHFGINLMKDHVVERYFQPLTSISVTNDNQGLDYFISPMIRVNINPKEEFIAWCIGASYHQKTLSKNQIIEVANKLPYSIILLGGIEEKLIGDSIIRGSSNKKIYNFCGSFSLDQSAYVLRESTLVLTNDTGLMHIASAFKKPIISFWGCTKPSLGFRPYASHVKSTELVVNPEFSPCSKHGHFCKYGKDGCLKKLQPIDIQKVILDHLKPKH